MFIGADEMHKDRLTLKCHWASVQIISGCEVDFVGFAITLPNVCVCVGGGGSGRKFPPRRPVCIPGIRIVAVPKN